MKYEVLRDEKQAISEILCDTKRAISKFEDVMAKANEYYTVKGGKRRRAEDDDTENKIRSDGD